MDSEHWISRLAAAKRFYAAQLGHAGGAADRGAGMDELDMDDEPPPAMPEFACPYCYEHHDVASLCAHLEEEHPFEPHAAVVEVMNEYFHMEESHGLSEDRDKEDAKDIHDDNELLLRWVMMAVAAVMATTMRMSGPTGVVSW